MNKTKKRIAVLLLAAATTASAGAPCLAADTVSCESLKEWTFDSDTESWGKGGYWTDAVTGGTAELSDGALRIDENFTGCTDTWNKTSAAVALSGDYSAAERVSFDYYTAEPPEYMMTVFQADSSCGWTGLETTCAFEDCARKNGKTVDGTSYIGYTVSIAISDSGVESYTAAQIKAGLYQFMIGEVRTDGTYNGYAYFDNVKIQTVASRCGVTEINTDSITDGSRGWTAEVTVNDQKSVTLDNPTWRIISSDNKQAEIGARAGASTTITGGSALIGLSLTEDAIGGNRINAVEFVYDGTAANGFVYSTKTANGGSALTYNNGSITTAAGETAAIDAGSSTADGNAGDKAKATYAYLKAISGTKSVLFGHQNDISCKAGAAELSESDVYDAAGDYAAVCGLDALSLTGGEFSAYVCNSRYGTDFPTTAAGNVRAAAYLTNKAAANGAIVTLSAHMPNFSTVTETNTAESETYAKYDFNVFSSNDLTTGTVTAIMSDGAQNAKFTAYLDMVADYASQVNGAILFRPFHENTGSWFWWGADFCTADEYKALYRYTVTYLRDTRGVHNLLYVYSPGTEFTSADEFAERYPGDDYVDIVGFDMYELNPDGTGTWLTSLKEKLGILSSFAQNHGKLAALTETGTSYRPAVNGDTQTALLRKGNPDKDWFNNVLAAVSDSSTAYFMVWANFAEDNGFYTPYVKWVYSDGSLYGHEMLDNFIDFYNDSRSVFAADQKSVLENIGAK